ncbi:MAG: SH3 domain-containing protein [Bacteroidota bacterium]
MKNILILLSLFLSPFFILAQGTLTVQGDVVNVRKSANVNAEVVFKAKRFDELIVLEKGPKATVGGYTDNWYKVRSNNGKIGYTFGHFTSLKREGQITEFLTFTEAYMGDCLHLIFEHVDFGFGINNMSNAPNLEVDVDNEHPVYIGKQFKVTYNRLYAMHPENCTPDMPSELVTVPTIVDIKQSW